MTERYSERLSLDLTALSDIKKSQKKIVVLTPLQNNMLKWKGEQQGTDAYGFICCSSWSVFL